MLSMVEVKCPHCGARGQIMLPPTVSIIVGPCPQCHNIVAVFAGQAMPLSNEIMLQGSIDEKRLHMMQVLGEFLSDRVNRLLKDSEPPSTSEKPTEETAAMEETLEAMPDPDKLPGDAMPQYGPAMGAKADTISDQEMDTFVRVELKLLDNREYFKAVFE